jgi:hypothetical protein
MRVVLGSLVLALAVGCATHKEKKTETQVVTFPDGAIVQFNGQNAGRAPAKIILPQDDYGQLTGRAVVRAIPNTKQQNLVEQVRVFDPNERKDPVPNQIVIDMTLPSTNATPQEIAAAVQEESRPKVRKRAPYVHVERSKPTQAVGLDRYNPGEH